jgi:hypothetical protein
VIAAAILAACRLPAGRARESGYSGGSPITLRLSPTSGEDLELSILRHVACWP